MASPKTIYHVFKDWALSIKKIQGSEKHSLYGGQSHGPRLRNISVLIGCGGHCTEAEWTPTPTPTQNLVSC